MNFTMVLKLMVGFISGIMFWFFFFLVTTVYAFMPITKAGHERIFIIASQILYLAVAGKLMSKLFSEKGWKKYLANTLITVIMAALSLFTADFLMKLF